MSVITKIGESFASKKVATKAFHTAYKAAPGQTMGAYAKQHRWGVGLTAASFVPIHSATRRSTHTGIDTKDGS